MPKCIEAVLAAHGGQHLTETPNVDLSFIILLVHQAKPDILSQAFQMHSLSVLLSLAMLKPAR